MSAQFKQTAEPIGALCAYVNVTTLVRWDCRVRAVITFYLCLRQVLHFFIIIISVRCRHDRCVSIPSKKVDVTFSKTTEIEYIGHMCCLSYRRTVFIKTLALWQPS